MRGLRPLFRKIGQGGSGGGSSIPGLDADAVSWALAVEAAGSTYNAATLAAVSNFCTSAKASGYWVKLNRLNLFCGNDLTAALIPLKAGGGSATDTNVNFVGGDYSESTGLTGNGTTKYLRTGFLPSTQMSLTSGHIALYNRSSTQNGRIGATTSPAADAARLYAPDAGTLYSDLYNNVVGGGRLSAAVGTPYGFLVGSRTAANSHTIYRNGASVGTNALTGGALPTIEIYVGAFNIAGVPLEFTSCPMAAYSIGDGLSGAEVLAYHTHMETFQDALGRGVA